MFHASLHYRRYQLPISTPPMRSTEDALRSFLRQASITNEEYGLLRNADRFWRCVRRRLLLVGVAVLLVSVVAASSVALSIVFPRRGRPFCSKHPFSPSGIVDDSMHSYFFTEYEATQFFLLGVFIPTVIIFVVSATYLFSGIAVAYAAPDRHSCVRVVENNCCASKKGGVSCLATLNASFAGVFGLLAIFLGSTVLTFQTDCSITLFWCYEIMSWSFVLLYGGTFLALRRKAAVILDEGEFYGTPNIGVELLEGFVEPTLPGMERRVNAAFKSWMGPSILLDDDDDGSEDEENQMRHGLGDIWEDGAYNNLWKGTR